MTLVATCLMVSLVAQVSDVPPRAVLCLDADLRLDVKSYDVTGDGSLVELTDADDQLLVVRASRVDLECSRQLSARRAAQSLAGGDTVFVERIIQEMFGPVPVPAGRAYRDRDWPTSQEQLAGLKDGVSPELAERLATSGVSLDALGLGAGDSAALLRELSGMLSFFDELAESSDVARPSRNEGGRASAGSQTRQSQRRTVGGRRTSQTIQAGERPTLGGRRGAN